MVSGEQGKGCQEPILLCCSSSPVFLGRALGPKVISSPWTLAVFLTHSSVP